MRVNSKETSPYLCGRALDLSESRIGWAGKTRSDRLAPNPKTDEITDNTGISGSVSVYEMDLIHRPNISVVNKHDAPQ